MKSFFCILFLGVFCLTFSQNQPESSNKKVGLVLSGGGAKGLAHIGVLQVIDSLGVKVDYIAGTSMGAIIGSLYASGYSGKELDSIFNTVDFDAIISDELPRRSKSFFERMGDNRYAVTLPVTGGKVSLPSALSKGQNTFNLLTKLLLHVSDINDFSKLPIPFFCVATDIETGEPVVLDSGNLAKAVTASGAFPSLFQPVIINNRVLVDGGVTDNYPIKRLKEKNVEHIIGVDVQDSLLSREELKSAPRILLQINNYRTIKEMVEKRKLTDIYIKPDVKNFTVVSFSKGADLIANGKAAALKHIKALKQLKSSKAPNKPLNIKSLDSIRINAIYVKGNKQFTRSYIIGKLKLREYEKTSYKRLLDGVNSVVSSGNFDDFSYSLKPVKTGEGYDLYTTVTENKTKMFFKVAAHYDDLYQSAILLNSTYKGLLFKNDITSLDFIIGDKIRYKFDYFIDKGFYVSVGLSSRYNTFEHSIDPRLFLTIPQTQNVMVNRVGVNYSDFTNTVFLQTLFLKDFFLRAGLEYKRLNITSNTVFNNTKIDQWVFEKSNYYGVFGELELDTYDNLLFPTKGVFFNGKFKYYLDSSNFSGLYSDFIIASAEFGIAQKIYRNLALNFKTQGGFQIGENKSPYLNFILGGNGNNFVNNIHPFLGYDYLSLTGNSFVKAELKLDYNFWKVHHFNATANFANIQDNLFESGEWFYFSSYSGYALGYGFETFLGPIELKYSWSPELTKSYWFFNLGFWF